MLLPFNNPKKVDGKIRNIFAGDIGATKTNLALFKMKGSQVVSLHEARYKSRDYKNIIDLIKEFTQDTFPLPDAICFGVAGPVLNGRAKLSNLDWEIDSGDLSVYFKTKKVHLINDLEATAYGLALLHEQDVALIHTGDNTALGNAAIIAPGTGLGEAGLFWDGRYYQPFATEGGHSDFASRNEFDFELFTFLQNKYGHVSWERVICGPGIFNIYEFLRDEKKMEEPGWLKEQILKEDAAAVISRHVSESQICTETMRLFIRFLAYESANLVLKLNATGGLFIAGGIAPQIISLFENNAFYTSFCQSGRLSFLLEKVPVKIILNSKAALLGAAFYGAKN